MERLSIFSIIATVIVHLVTPVYTCGGYKLSVDYFRNCGKSGDIIQFSNDFRPVLNDDCMITMNGCVTVKRPIKTAEVFYDVSKNGAHYRGTMNGCQALESARGEMLSIMDSIGAPSHCPIREGTVCGQGKQISIRRHRMKLPMMSGTTRGKMEVKTNAGNMCVEFAATLNRRFFSG